MVVNRTPPTTLAPYDTVDFGESGDMIGAPREVGKKLGAPEPLTGVEPASYAWQAQIIAVIPQ